MNVIECLKMLVRNSKRKISKTKVTELLREFEIMREYSTLRRWSYNRISYQRILHVTEREIPFTNIGVAAHPDQGPWSQESDYTLVIGAFQDQIAV